MPFEPILVSRRVSSCTSYACKTGRRCRTSMKAAGIGTGIHYPVPLHMQQAYRHLGYRNGELPVTERVSAEILSLPMYPQLSAAQQAKVVETLRSCLMSVSSVS